MTKHCCEVYFKMLRQKKNLNSLHQMWWKINNYLLVRILLKWEPLYTSITVLFWDISPEKVFNFFKAVTTFGGKKQTEIIFGYVCVLPTL